LKKATIQPSYCHREDYNFTCGCEIEEKRKKRQPMSMHKKIILLTIWLLIGCGNEHVNKPPFTKSDALAYSHLFVDQKLISPGSAQWAYQDEQSIDQLNDTTYRIISYVDSQNKFGALLRTYYKCDIIHSPSTGKVDCQNLILEQH
jgi:hypothetical protein